MQKLKNDALKNPIENLVIIILLAVGVVCFPTKELCGLLFGTPSLEQTLFFGGILKVIFAILISLIAIAYGFKNPYKNKISIKGLLIVIPTFLVAINNAPIVGLINKSVEIQANATQIIAFITYCIGIGAVEEAIFRGAIFPLMAIIFKNKKMQPFLTVLFSSVVFGLMHLLNLISGQSVGATLLQIGYSFLIGAMCGYAMLETKSIYIPIILHAIYDIGGKLVNEGIAVGGFSDIWNPLEIVITAILGVIVAVYVIVRLIKMPKTEIDNLYDIPTAE